MKDVLSYQYHDINATQFKQNFGKTLEDVAHGHPVRIIRHGRQSDRLVLLREDELAALQARAGAPLDALREQFDDMVARMQTAKARKVAASIGSVQPDALGQAALQAVKLSD